MAACKISPIPDIPLLHMKKAGVIVAADLHIGIEREFLKMGVTVPPVWPRMAEEILKASRNPGAKRLVLLGDVKHGIPFSSIAEERAIPAFFHTLLQHMEVEIILGNHDGWLKRLVPRGVDVHSSEGLVLDGVGLLHGHCWPSEEVMSSETLVMGHIHPCISLEDEIGTATILPCWLRAASNPHVLDRGSEETAREIVVMPAMSRIRRGVPVNRSKGIGPLARSGFLDVGSAVVHLLDGTVLGDAGGIS